MIEEVELEFRRRRFAQIQEAMQEDSPYVEGRRDAQVHRRERETEVVGVLARLARDENVDAFRTEIDSWSRRPGYDSFSGFGQMFLNQLVKLSPDSSELAALLVDVLAAPTDDGEARRKLAAMIAHVETIKEGAQPAPKRSLYVLSLFWSLSEPEQWPCMWSSAEDALLKLGWLSQAGVGSTGLPSYYLAFRDSTTVLGSWADVGDVLQWFRDHSWVGLDVSLADRLARAAAFSAEFSDDYPEDLVGVVVANVQAIRSDFVLLGRSGEKRIGEATGRKLPSLVPQIQTRPGHYRDNCWVRWQIEDSSWASKPGIQMVADANGIVVGMYPGQRERGWSAVMRPELEAMALDGLEFLPIGGATGSSTDIATDKEYLLGRWFPIDSAIGRVDFLDEIVAIAAAAQAALDHVVRRGGGVERLGPVVAPADWLQESFDRFVAEQGYPNEVAKKMIARREQMAALLGPDVLPLQDLATIRRIYSSGAYGSPGPQSVLNTTLRDDDTAFPRLIEALQFLLWGDESVAERIDACLDPERYGMKGLGESVLMKYLAIAHPEQIIPVFPLRGDNGKLRLLEAFGESLPDPHASRGTLQMDSNELLRARLEPLMPSDPWGQGQFAYWLRDNPQAVPEVDPLEAARLACCLSDTSFFVELRELLQEKKQIVLYGPPGTGKTFIARALSRALVTDLSRYRLVQFHPATSYEDFFEGYRPIATAEGGVAYELTSGPLADLADRAAQDPALHVLVIDELNRANVPKVLGELLFLLEYRDEEIASLYRPGGFSLPENLWIIATMNTADRSIATLDAALRRRFHFVPIFPDEGPMEGVLGRFLESNRVDPQWAELVGMVNEELRDRLGNGDLLLGPSYFMKAHLDEARMKQIWEYDVDPLIADIFYGDQSSISYFRWPQVLKRHRGRSGEVAAPEELSTEAGPIGADAESVLVHPPA